MADSKIGNHTKQSPATSKVGDDPTISRTLGDEDTFSMSPRNYADSEQGVVNSNENLIKAPWVRLFKENRETIDSEFKLEFLEPTKGRAHINRDELLEIREEWTFALLGCFAGRFPGLKAIRALVDSWKTPCKISSKPNGFILFRFQTDSDKMSVVEKGPYCLFGKRLFLCILPDRFHLDNSDFYKLPIWVQFPDLPMNCWHPKALSRIASCNGKQICTDRMTKEMRRGNFARVLIEIDTSEHPNESMSVNLPNDVTFNQPVVYELQPCFCLKCHGKDHHTENCKVKYVIPQNRRHKKVAGSKVKTPLDQGIVATDSKVAKALTTMCGTPAETSKEPAVATLDSSGSAQLIPAASTKETLVPANKDHNPSTLAKEVILEPAEPSALENASLANPDSGPSFSAKDNSNSDAQLAADALPNSTNEGQSESPSTPSNPKGFKDVLLAPGNLITTRSKTMGGRGLIPLPLGEKPMDSGGGRRASTSHAK